MKVLFVIFALLLFVGVAVAKDVENDSSVMVAPEGTTLAIVEDTPAITLEEEYLSFFGSPLKMFLVLSGILFFLVEGIKKKLPKVFMGGEKKWKTDVLLVVLAVLLSLKVFFPDPVTIIACVVGLSIGGAGIHTLKKSIIK